IEKLREDVQVSSAELIDTKIDGSTITEAGVRNNISVAIQYIANWLGGTGAVAIFNLMEDAATAEISRSQLWQWIRNEARTDGGETVTTDVYRRLRDSEVKKLTHLDQHLLRQATEILDDLVLSDYFEEFLTLPAYDKLLDSET
ncbi:MAG: malate synthase A, partial [Gammaproteobacteria bacterium]|nr:malate synthase A [Gammaproteobacteria bacterium]